MIRAFLVLYRVGWEGVGGMQVGFLVSCLYHHILRFFTAVSTGNEEMGLGWRAIQGAGCEV